MKIKTPFHHLRYRVLSKRYSWRTPKQAIKCWRDWDVVPWFKKMDCTYGHEDKPRYRWKRLKVYKLFKPQD